MTRFLLVLSLVLGFTLEATPRRRAVAIKQHPACNSVTGTAGVTFTRDEGRTVAPSNVPLHGIAYTYGLTALGAADTLVAWHRDDLLFSDDGGCSWRAVAKFDDWDFPPRITAAGESHFYAWSDNREYLVRADSTAITKLKPPAAFVGLGVDPHDSRHVRAGADDGAIWESTDGGDTWTQTARLGGSAIYYRFTFDPADLDHIVAGTATNGAHVSRDGGRTWTRAKGIGDAPQGAQVFNLVISPVDPNIVWAMGIDNAESIANVPSHGRHIYLSRDGGATYEVVVDEAPGVKLINGPTMAAHPRDPNILYFVFGSAFQGYGTDIFRYDAATRALTMTHNDHHDVNAIAFSHDGSVMYLGLEREER